jgi:SWI2/SNF2 ATPase
MPSSSRARTVILRRLAYFSLTANWRRASVAGGVVFTTVQKFMPAESGDRNAVLSDRRNIVVIADETHRSHYDFIDGSARHMRDALPQARRSAPTSKRSPKARRSNARKASSCEIVALRPTYRRRSCGVTKTKPAYAPPGGKCRVFMLTTNLAGSATRSGRFET